MSASACSALWPLSAGLTTVLQRGRQWFSEAQREETSTLPKVTSLPGAKARLTLGLPGSKVGPLPPARRLPLCLGSVCWLLTRGKRRGWLRELPLLPQGVCVQSTRAHPRPQRTWRDRKQGSGLSVGTETGPGNWLWRKSTRRVGDDCAGLGSRRLRYPWWRPWVSQKGNFSWAHT